MVGIVCFWDRIATPYLSKYERLLSASGIDYKIIFWCREYIGKKNVKVTGDKEIFVNYHCSLRGLRKYLSFFFWSRIVKKIIKKEKFDQLIVLTTTPAVFLNKILINKYKDNYIFDIRDYTFEKNRIFSSIVTKVVDCSALTPISSKGYLKWLKPNKKIIVNHNISFVQSERGTNLNLKDKRKIALSFVGNVRLDAQTRALVLNLKESDYIIQKFYGRVLSTCDIDKIKDEYGINNLELYGPFKSEDKWNIYEDTDLINCVYANSKNDDSISFGDSTPIPNRLYDCLYFYRPMVVSKGTYLADLTEKYRIGVTLNGFDSKCEEIIKNYCESFNFDEFKKNCDCLYKEVLDEEVLFEETIKDIFNCWK